ncbi:hemolysin III, putative [Plasmodium malariae]|uniref:Hemolysin III, putative n=1 Tax=Plasmodium malariae TaxID=5858 RepID=A0A1C3L1G5_PLAMA|nr:hemolysin III, putative [Plasmodium malariae]
MKRRYINKYYIIHALFAFYTFLILLAILYVVGAIIYSIKKPNIIAGIIEFHDVFHMCCLGSAVCTFALNCSVIRRKS